MSFFGESDSDDDPLPSSTTSAELTTASATAAADEEDELDAFMSNLKEDTSKRNRAERLDDDEEGDVLDEEEFGALKKTRVEANQPKNDKTLTLQSKPRPTGPVHKTFPPLNPPVHPYGSALNPYLNKNRMQIIPSPGRSLPPQSVLFPLICSGSNVHALSPTGTGKTLSYVLPMLKHLDASVSATSPCALILGPTRELIIQINSVIKPLLKPNQKSLALYGGILSSEKHSTWSITSRLKKEKIDVIVSTSTRLIDFIKSKSLSLDDITILIFDEIDRLTNKQFRDSVCAVEGLVNADAVRVGVSATNGGEDVVRRWLNVDYKVVVFPEKVKRSVEEFIVNNLIQEGAKLKWLKHTLTSLVRVGGVIVFCGRRVTCEKVGDSVKLYLECKTLHGDVQQSVREDNLKAFRKGETKVRPSEERSDELV
ncbi:hypothetical protein TL16_g02521 [Triparma laevis f. inornata]|uniref:ATP-dependent RNA helicase n=1 Tax=Triparma laevis f. inornata TaxID=1714386 RepID=A0A9W6ZTD4_9STRA|nr:hypothetical protein TL16_g02521 [Triparma laevis f. inornata]